MPTEEEVLIIGKKLEKMIAEKTTEHSSVVDMLKTLQNLPMKLTVLQKTRIGMTVNNLRKASSSDEVVSVSKVLIKGWRKLLPDSGKSDQKKEKPENNGEKNSEEMEAEPQTSDERRSSTSASDTSDPVRMKCRELLAKALKVDGDNKVEGNDPVELGGLIEDNIYEDFKNTDTKYKNRVRSRVANLKDSKNPALRENVKRGLIPPDRIARMTAEEMSSDVMKDLRSKYTKESIDDHQMAKTGGTVSDLFKCGKCRKSNCTYNQVQTRSADEPMTTFVLCNECGNRWKFC